MYEFSYGETLRSKLTFITSQESRGAIDFGNLQRVRKAVTRSKSGVQGKVADTIHGRSRHAESQNELKGFRVLLATGQTDAWQEQPCFLEYHHDGAKHHYTPDILVVWGTHREIVEIKEDSEAELPENQQRFALIRELLGDHGFFFRVWKKSEICAEPRLSNVGLVLRYRCIDVSPMTYARVRKAFSSTSEASLGEFCKSQAIAVDQMLCLVLDGTLHLNWWQPLTLKSIISCVPIGPQIWPSSQSNRVSIINLIKEVQCRDLPLEKESASRSAQTNI